MLRPSGVINTAPRDRGKLWHLSLVVSGQFVDGRRRRRNVYDKKSQRYAKDNRTALIVGLSSDKSIACVTDNKRLCSTLQLKLTSSDRQKATRGLFATTELLVLHSVLHHQSAKPARIGPWRGKLTIVFQCYDAVDWIIWRVKSYPKWPVMCRARC